MKNSLILVRLNSEQIERAKEVNGNRKKFTHALLCGEYGQILGTEKKCYKYFHAWETIFSDLFFDIKVCNEHHIQNYETTFNLVNILFEALDGQKPSIQIKPVKKQGLWSRLFK
ncbi:hypothetical protein ACXJY6_09065 [Vibrio sp. RC27]